MSKKKIIKMVLVALSVLLSAAESVDNTVDRRLDDSKTNDN